MEMEYRDPLIGRIESAYKNRICAMDKTNIGTRRVFSSNNALAFPRTLSATAAATWYMAKVKESDFRPRNGRLEPTQNTINLRLKFVLCSN